ncbi:gamma-aminobutyric acid receptor subunit pi isoform X3 [Ascaphus truei]|uniref:gamma-aminobutyric acid receptor subunit pi isoform X3 n=1 Tax=Ascaphus truei TaxID=8439 RepID=UPI003F598480
MYCITYHILFFWTLLLKCHMSRQEEDDKVVLPGFHLTKSYNKYLRPKLNEKPVDVAVTLEVASIDAVSEENMDYTATILLRQRWIDERLVFDGNKSITLDARLVELIWVPDTYVVDSKKSFLHDVTTENRLVRLFSNGTVLYALRITTTVACNMDLSKYPMDKQTCKLQLESWGYTIEDLTFTWMRGDDSIRGMDTLQLFQYTVERYYTKAAIGYYETGNYPRLALHFVLQRNITYFILETYIPAILLVILSWVSFWISMSSVPSRTGIGVTTVLAMTTILMGSRTSVQSANCIKAIDIYLGICFSFIFGALLEYAIAHYCSEQNSAAKQDEKKNPTEELEDTKVTVFDSYPEELSRKESLIENAQMEFDSSMRKASNGTLKLWLKNKGKIRKFIIFFTVKNPENVDRYSKLVFPLVFVIINVFYWTFYLYM